MLPSEDGEPLQLHRFVLDDTRPDWPAIDLALAVPESGSYWPVPDLAVAGATRGAAETSTKCHTGYVRC